MQQRERMCAFLSGVTGSDGKENIASVGVLGVDIAGYFDAIDRWDYRMRTHDACFLKKGTNWGSVR
jgi:hypothetical protein